MDLKKVKITTLMKKEMFIAIEVKKRHSDKGTRITESSFIRDCVLEWCPKNKERNDIVKQLNDKYQSKKKVEVQYFIDSSLIESLKKTLSTEETNLADLVRQCIMSEIFTNYNFNFEL